MLHHFIHQHQQDIHNHILNNQQSIKINILSPSQLQSAAQLIQSGKLVAFPTQTVYGLGANALNQKSLLQIFQVKKRPLTDPIIVHVLDRQQAQKIVEIAEQQRQLFELLTDAFWPGPLTIILKANPQIPTILTAESGFVGVRSPKHPIARELIRLSKLPIGAPSANLFSHVSPTESVHVFNDFYSDDISIVDGGRCSLGVESTVVKIAGNQLLVLREGSLLIPKLKEFIDQTLKPQKRPKIIFMKGIKKANQKMEAPGQLLKHYAPNIPCYFMSKLVTMPSLQSSKGKLDYKDIAFISFNGEVFEPISKLVKYYFQAGCTLQQSWSKQFQVFCGIQEANKLREIYYLLRKCQNLDVKAIVLGWSAEKEGTIWDKIYRSTQGLQLKESNE